MKYIVKRYRSALVIQIMLAQIQATYCIYPTQRNFLQQDGRNANYRYEDLRLKDTYYLLRDIQMKDRPNTFIRKVKSGNQPRILSIDLSGLRQDKDIPVAYSTSRHKSPMNLLGIDISVLSRNPDPTLPVAIVHPKNILNDKSIMSYDFDPKYDRLPNIKAKPMHTYSSINEIDEKPAKVVPIMHLPLKVMTTHHSILTNKKHDTDFKFNSGNSSDAEREQKYTANFILHLLYQLSSNYKKVNDN